MASVAGQEEGQPEDGAYADRGTGHGVGEVVPAQADDAMTR